MKKNVIILLGIALLTMLIACNPKPKINYLYTITNEKIDAEQLKDEPVIWAAEISLNDSLLRSEKIKLLRIILDNKKEMTIALTYQDRKKRVSNWIGTIKDDPQSQVIFVMTPKNTVAGNIRTSKGDLYKIRYLKEGKYLLAKIDANKYPEDAPEVEPQKDPNEVSIAFDCPNTDPASKIDVMVLYTDDARSAAGGTGAIESEILLAVEETNTAYINSNITQRLNLVYMAEVNYAETSNPDTDLAKLQGASDGILDNIHTLRDSHSADLVSLIVENMTGASGIGYVMTTVSTSWFEDYAFSVVKRTSATGNYSFGHELGHNMGAKHDCNNNSTTTPYVYAHGYYNTSPTPVGVGNWRTIMSYSPPVGSATRICYFSNPGITYPPGATDGDVMGTSTGACQADNHLTLNNTALTVANFRCTGSGIENVWMKDTWNDTGQEPDPNTASESMWRSPYIWVRNDRDASFLHQHQHQDPIYGTGISNWVYVKLHNGGAAMSGNLEVYYANASVSLTWPTGWTLIQSLPLTINASSTDIAEIEWASLPGTGHYCLLARWNSTSDPMHAAEGSNISYNVRQNNNIVWKNVNIVPATSGDAPVTAKFSVSSFDTLSVLRVSCDDEYPNKAFSKNGLLSIQFDEKSQAMLKNWKPNNPDIIVKGNTYIIKGTQVDFSGLPFDRKYKGEITITFQAYKGTPKMLYVVNVKMLRKVKGKEVEIGGVSYEINTQLK